MVRREDDAPRDTATSRRKRVALGSLETTRGGPGAFAREAAPLRVRALSAAEGCLEAGGAERFGVLGLRHRGAHPEELVDDARVRALLHGDACRA